MKYHSIFSAIADKLTLPHLQSFSLSGFPVTELSLLRFLSNHTGLQNLTGGHHHSPGNMGHDLRPNQQEYDLPDSSAFCQSMVERRSQRNSH